VTKGKEGPMGAANKRYADRVKKSRSREVGLHFENGIGIHHAGMLRGDRKLTEQMFADGAIRVLCCTATLAWGVNLPVHSVIIKGTEVYNPEKGGVVDLSILDVQQIFGRAGRPQFDSSGEATLITTHEALSRYLDKLVRAVPIESNFIKQLADHLNAEIVGGTVTNIREAAAWIKYSYLYVRMLRNPLAYGINADQFADDPQLNSRCMELVKEAAKLLDYNRMIRYGEDSGNLSATARGRVAAGFYVNAESVAIFNEGLDRNVSPTDSDLARLICSADEFKNMKMRQEELSELDTLAKTTCPLDMSQPFADGANQSLVNDEVDKCFVLMQAFISRHRIKGFTLIADMNYLASNSARVARAIFEMCIREGQAGSALKLLRIAKSVDNQIWWFQTPLRHFEGELKNEVFLALENQNSGGYDSLEWTLSLLDMHPNEVGQLSKWYKGGAKIQHFVKMIPKLDIHCMVQPVTGSVLRFHIDLQPAFEWSQRWHGGAQSFWLWVEDGENSKM
jgi:activating signal cointegrator complex subunit 3